MLTQAQKEFRAKELQARVQGLYRASQLPRGGGLTYYYKCQKQHFDSLQKSKSKDYLRLGV